MAQRARPSESASEAELLTSQMTNLGSDLDRARTDARERTISLLRELETRLHSALGQGKILGLPSLLPPAYPKFLAARVHGNGHHGISSYLPEDGRPALVWDEYGIISWAWKLEQGHVEVRPVKDDEIAAQDLEPALRSLRDALLGHIRRAERSTSTYRAISELARKMDAVLNT